MWLALLLGCALVGGSVAVAGLGGGSDSPDIDGRSGTTTDVADGSFDPSPSEVAQTTGTAMPEEDETTPAPTGTPTPTPTATEGPTPTSTDASDGTDASDVDVESREPSDFEEAAEGGSTSDPNDSDATDGSDGESRDDPPDVEARSRSRMPTRGPERGTIVVSFDDGPVSTISFSRRHYGNVTVEVLDGLPSDVRVPAGDRLTTLRITVPSELRNGSAKVVFTVDVATLEAWGVPNDAVWLARHDTDAGEWDRLDTHVVHTSDERVAYAANATGFPLFAVQGDGSRARSPTPTGTANGFGPGAPEVKTADEAEAATVGGFGFPLGAVLFMGVLSVATTVFGARRVSTREPREEN